MPLKHSQMTLEPGTKLVARHKRIAVTATVVRRFRLADGREFKSLSAAAKAITGTAVNGYRFWAVAQPETSNKTSTSRKTSVSRKTTRAA